MQSKVMTEVMPTWKALWRQRMRWQRGALENIGAYGVTRATLRYRLQQLGIGYGTIALNAYLLLMLITLLSADGLEILWFWAAIGTIFIAERVVTVWTVGWRGRLLAFPLFVELGYDLGVWARVVVPAQPSAAGAWSAPGERSSLSGLLLGDQAELLENREAIVKPEKFIPAPARGRASRFKAVQLGGSLQKPLRHHPAGNRRLSSIQWACCSAFQSLQGAPLATFPE